MKEKTNKKSKIEPIKNIDKNKIKRFKIGVILWLLVATLFLIGGFKYLSWRNDLIGSVLFFLNSFLCYLAALGFYLRIKVKK
jgi:hypothetical protein